ncbi:hypothetical protein CYMTET_31863 [Cymbomonas tetramitiformis]|uniref:EF-hand domain-containing protein n=1 Tax=Cymbomonas tetramitiformis TaxID=36881 RepID=A0AAE0KST1_9CHLO|nr:hypothetical protein CYMTET_31863 [Cymbomonas tetramitiformis]
MFGRVKRHKKAREALDAKNAAVRAGIGTDEQIDALAPGMTLKHLGFAKTKMAYLNASEGGDEKDSLDVKKVLDLFVLCGMNPTQDAVDALIKENNLDTQKDVDVIDFLILWSKYKNNSHEEKLLFASFQFLDRDGNGVMSLEEFTDIMTDLGETPLTREECTLFTSLIDKNNDGVVQYDEFISALRDQTESLL